MQLTFTIPQLKWLLKMAIFFRIDLATLVGWTPLGWMLVFLRNVARKEKMTTDAGYQSQTPRPAARKLVCRSVIQSILSHE